MKNSKKNVLISGSLVYDRIMDFPGYFKDNIMPEKIHILNVSFVVNGVKESFGGTAGNIAYSLALLGERPTILSTVGNDFSTYSSRLRKLKIDISQIKIIKDKNTASCYITTDKSDNQITAFNPGALSSACGSFPKKYLADAWAIVSPGNIADMVNYCLLYKKNKVKFIFDPGQQTIALSAGNLQTCINGAEILIGNDYEISLIAQKIGWTTEKILDKVNILIITKGEKGSEIWQKNQPVIMVKVKKAKKVVDPTGAGDAYRAGLIKGLVSGFNIFESCELASKVAVKAVEKQGTQEHVLNFKLQILNLK